MRDRHSHTQSSEGTPTGVARTSSRFGWLLHPAVRSAWLVGHGSAIGVLLVLFLSVVSEQVYPTSVQLTVSATVLKKVWARKVGSPAGLHVTEADLARGYLDVAQPTVFIIRNNSDDGFLLSLEADAGLVSRVSVSGLLQGTAEFGPTGGYVAQPGYFKQETRFELRWRLYLTSEATAGPHPWPVLVEVQAK
jgi:hypothetical protein